MKALDRSFESSKEGEKSFETQFLLLEIVADISGCLEQIFSIVLDFLFCYFALIPVKHIDV